MKKIILIFSMILCILFISNNSAEAVSIIKLGKGGLVINPNGNVKMCPKFALRKCCKIDISWSDIWNWITDNGSWHNDVNTQLPVNGNAVVYDDDGMETGTYNVQITWLKPGVGAEVNGDEIIVGNDDINIEVVQ